MKPLLATEWSEDLIADQSRSRQLPLITSAEELLRTPSPKPPEVVQHLLHQGSKMVLGGASKTNKTWVLTDLAISVACGAQWWGFETNQGRVLYVNFELAPPFFAERIKAVASAKGLNPGTELDVWNLRGHGADFDQLYPQIVERAGQRYVLVILDPTYKVLGQRDENRAGDIASLLNRFEQLAVETEAAVAFGAHFSKGNQAAKDSIDRIGGSGVFARDPDTILTMTRHEVDGAFCVEPILRNHPPTQPFVVRWQFPLMQCDESLDPRKLKQPKKGQPAKYTVEDLVNTLRTSAKGGRAKGGPRIRAAEFQKFVTGETGMSRSTFYTLFGEAKRQGIFEQKSDKWQLVQKVQ